MVTPSEVSIDAATAQLSWFGHKHRIFGLLSIGQLKDWTGNDGEREDMSCSGEPQGGIKPVVAAERTQPTWGACCIN